MSFKQAAANIHEDSGQQFQSLNSIVQWVNGDQQLAPLGNTAVAYTGGFVCLHDRIIGDIRKTGWVEQKIKIGGDVQSAIVAPRALFAVIAARSRWEETQGDNGQKGQTRRIQVLAVPRGAFDSVVITMAGHAQIGMQDALRQFQSKILNPAGQIAGLAYPFPSYAFYIDVSTSAHKMVGKTQRTQSEVTSPAIVLPDFNGDQATLEAYLEQYYVGDENLKRFEMLYKQAQLWAAQWNDKDKAVEKTDDGEVKPDGIVPAEQVPQGQPNFAQPEFQAAYQMQAPAPPPLPGALPVTMPTAQPAPLPAPLPAPAVASAMLPTAAPAPVSNVLPMPAAAPAMPNPQSGSGVQILPSNWATTPPAPGQNVGAVANQGKEDIPF